MQLYLLGTFLLQADQPIHLPRRKVEALLAYLVLYPQEHTRDELATLFWGDVPDARARTSLRTALRVLRQALTPDILASERATVQLNPDFPLWADTRAMESAHRALQTAAHELSAQELDAVCDLYRGDLLTESYEDWIVPLREHYRRIYLDLLLYRVQQLRAASEYERALQMAQRVLATDPANEHAFQHLMFCQVALGNRQAALQTYAQCVDALRAELNVAPLPETIALHEWISQTRSGTATRAARLTNLPVPLNSFVGRQREMATLKEYLARGRMVTLTGAGGSGKTRLAIQAGIELLDAFPDGVWWVELASLADETLVPWAVAKALGVREQPEQALAETLGEWLAAPRRLLLVLDNCEHLIAACAQFAEHVLRAGAGVKILTTSREPLRIQGEQVWNVPTLAVPDAKNITLPDLLLEYEAIRLFVERARLVNSDFRLTDTNVFAVVKICERLDGIPLAIELAAARVNVLSPQEIAARLGDRFQLLANGPRAVLPRQQTLRALIDWSYDLLTPPERTLFWRLGVFSGGRTLQAIEAVCAGGEVARENILELLARLVSKSLLTAQEKLGETRYSFLDTIKQYARETLRASGESDAVRDRHLAYYLQFAVNAESALAGPQQALWMAKLELDHYNLRNALEWAFATAQLETAFALAAALWRFWKVHGHYSEGRAWYARLLDAPQAAHVSPRTRAAALYAAGMLAYYQSDLASAQQFLEAALALQRALSDESGSARALAGLGLVLRAQGTYDAAQTCFQEALVLARRHAQTETIAACLRYLGLVAVAQGDYARAVELYEQALPEHEAVGDEEALANLFNNLAIALTYLGELERGQQLNQTSLEIRRRLDDLHGMALSLHTLSYYPRLRGEWAKARALLGEALSLYQRVGTKENTLECLESIAYCALQLGEGKHAAMLYSAAEQLRKAYHIPRSAPSQQEFENEVAQVRADDSDFDAAWEAGKQLTLEQASALALPKAK